jgi:hypothetical protein
MSVELMVAQLVEERAEYLVVSKAVYLVEESGKMKVVELVED